MFHVRLAPQSKSPVPGPLQISNDPAVHRAWLRSGCGLGNRLEENGHVAVDCDRIEFAPAAYVKLVQSGLCNLVSRTYRGCHFIFEGTAQTRPDDGFDLKGNGHIVWPPTTARSKDGTLWKYHFVVGDEHTRPLPFPAHLFQPPEKNGMGANIQVAADIDRLQLVSRALTYAAKMPESVAHNGGDNALYRFACRLVRQPPHGFGLTIEEAWPIALMFNRRCKPPWKESWVQRKLVEAKKKG